VLEVVKVDTVPREKKAAAVLALVPSCPLRPLASLKEGAVDRSEVTPTGGVRPNPILKCGDCLRIPPQNRMPGVRLATQRPYVAALEHLVLPSVWFFSGRQSIRARGDEFSMNLERKGGKDLQFAQSAVFLNAAFGATQCL